MFYSFHDEESYASFYFICVLRHGGEQNIRRCENNTFKCSFERHFFNFTWIYTNVFSPGSTWQCINIGSGRGSSNGLTPSLQQAIIWDIDDLVHRRTNVYIQQWWRHQMETFSTLLALCAGNSPVTGEFPTQRPVTRSFDVFFDLCRNKRLSKQSWGWWFEALSRPLWCHCNDCDWKRRIYCTEY